MFATNNATTASQPQARNGPDLVEITTETIGFLAIDRESKIRLLPEQWPLDSLPKPTSSLLSIASRSEILAAAAPSSLIISSTSAIREAFSSNVPAENNNVKPFAPQLAIPTPRISQVAFSSDESCLIISADQGGGLAVYLVDAIKQGSTEPAFQIGTNGVPVRALAPNPSPDSAHLIALALDEGQLMLADLKERTLVNTSNGPVLKNGVSCISWSAKGKQLVAGLADGTCVQMDPTGSVKAIIPRPPQLEGDKHVSSLTWLDNDHFLAIYNPTDFVQDSAPDSFFFLVSREPKTTNFTFQKVDDSPCAPIGMNRSPPHHFICRLRNFPPNLSDTLVISSTASGDLGLITCSKTPLSSNAPETANTYTVTAIGEDSRKAQLPPNDSMGDSSPIGMAWDLSSKDPVSKPIPSDEMDSSATPLPNLMALNHEGVLSSWWFVYADSIRQRQGFPGLIALGGDQQQQLQQQTQTQPQPPGLANLTQTQAPFGSSTNATSSPFAQSSAPTFGSPSALGFRGGSAFGSSSMIGANKSPWGSTGGSSAPQMGTGPALAKPAFGSSTSMGQPAGFAAVGGLGNRSSPWGAQNQQSSSQATAPNPFSSNTASSSPFASIAQQSSAEATSKPFAGFKDTSGASGFGALGQNSTSVFASSSTSPPALPSQPSFGSTVTIGSNLSSGPSTFAEPKSAWGTPALSNNPSNAFSRKDTFGSNQETNESDMTSGDTDMETPKPTDFKLQSSFKRDDGAEDNLSKPAGPSLFDSSFDTALRATESTKQTISESTKATSNEASTVVTTTDRSEDKLKESAPDSTKASTSAFPPVGEDQKVSSLEDSPVLVKQEFSDNDDVESAPLPPDLSSPTQAKSPSAEESEPPLPPDPSTTTKLPEAEEPPAPLPPDPVAETPSKPSRSTTSPAPLPPSLEDKTSSATEPPAAVEKSPEVLPLPPSETPLRSSQAREAVPTTPQAPLPAEDQSPVRQTSSQSSFSTTPTAPPPGRQHSSVFSAAKPTFQASRLSRVEESPVRSESKIEPEATLPEDIFDDSDIHIQQELAAPIEPTKTLAPFLTHQDYVSNVAGQGFAAQIEKVYRDINSMIDTLGLNARSLSAFVTGHEQFKDGGRIREDLEAGREDDWCLIEIADLSIVEREVEENLDEQRLRDVDETVTELQEMQKGLTKLRSRHHGLQQLIRANQGIDGSSGHQEAALDEARKALTTEQSILLSDLRKQFVEIQQQLALVEDSLTMLRAKVASVQTSLRGDRAGSKRVPTFEGVANTISKMTRMVEQRSGDVDLLQAQMRRLRARSDKLPLDSSVNLDEALGKLSLGSSLMSDRGHFTTPPASRGKGAAADYHTPPNRAQSNGTGSGQFQYNYDEESENETYESPLRRSIRGSGSQSDKNTIGRGVSQEDVQAFTAKEQRRVKVLALLKREVCKRGTLVHQP